MTGYKLDASGNCAIDADNLPCASGYSMVAGVCTACPAGCSSCDGNNCTSCIDGIMWGTSSSAAADMCTFNCSKYTCANTTSELCGKVAETINMVVACKAGY